MGYLMKPTGTIREKCHAVWADRRRWRKRLLLAAVPAFALCFTVVFFGPVEITAFSQSSLAFDVFDITLLMALAALAATAALSLVLSVLKGRVFDFGVSALFGFTLCAYLQGTFFNGNLGALTGDAIDWTAQKGAMAGNLVVWLLLFSVPFLVRSFSPKAWRRLVAYASALLLVMQGAALVGIYVSAEKKGDVYLSKEGMFDYSSRRNTIVFLVDRLDYDYIQAILRDDPTFFDGMDGFTGYTNAISQHARTKPAAHYLLTAYEKDAWQIPSETFFENAWAEPNILEALQKDGWRIDLYTEYANLFGKESTALKYADNASREANRLKTDRLMASLLDLSAYRYAPVVAKPFFWSYTDAVNQSAFRDGKIYEIDESQYDDGIPEFRLAGEQGAFKFYHFNGSHEPYLLNADGTRSEDRTSSLEQTKGCFQILFRALERMKELGIYESSGILITADHGNPVSDYEPLQKETRIGLFYKPAGAAGTPLALSGAPVSVKNIPATILKSAGLDYSGYGPALDEVAEDAEVVRTFYKSVLVAGWEKKLYIYEVRGDASQLENWVNVAVEDITCPFWK